VGGREAGRSKRRTEREGKADWTSKREQQCASFSNNLKYGSPDGILRYKTQKTPQLRQ